MDKPAVAVDNRGPEPKRAQSSYFHFLNEQRPLLMAKRPDLKFMEVNAELTEKWRALDDKAKAKYE